jgi:radical SAM superfamily enzyme YgiQ (UPF0313 family)
VDANAEGLSAAETAERVKNMDPLLVAVVVYGHNPSASTQNMPAAGSVCTQIKGLMPETQVLLVGGHVAALPARTLSEEDADFVCGGEGPYTVLDLLTALRQSTSPDLSKIRDLYFMEEGRVTCASAAPLVTSLDDEMPGVAWDLLPMGLYRAHNWHCYQGLQRQPYAALYTTLGCPFHCQFCCIQAPFRRGEGALSPKRSGGSYRMWSVDLVLAELETLVSLYGVKNIKLADEMFVLNSKHVLGICEGIVERGLDLNIWAYARVDTIKNDFLERLKDAGINWLAFGIEAGSDRVRDSVSKGIGDTDIVGIMNMVRRAGIYVGANYIFGLPEDNLQSMQATLDLALEINSEFANFYCAMAYPGSKLYDLAVANKWPLPDNWAGYSQLSKETKPLPTNYISSDEVLRFRDQAFQIYHSSQRYLAMIEQTFGLATVNHIGEMARQNIERSYE